MSAADLMARIEAARGDRQKASDMLAEARGMGRREEPQPPETEGGGLLDALGGISGIGHTVLDVAGFIPGLGVAADLIHAGWYAAEGDYKNAALSAAAAIPGAGDAAAAARLGARAFDAAQVVRRGAEAVDSAEGVAEGVEQIEQGNYENAGLAMGAAVFGARGGRGNNSDGNDGHSNRDDGSTSNEDSEPDYDRYDDYAERYGYGDDYEDPRARNYGDMGGNQRENRQFDAAQREAERRAGREFTRDERQEIHHRSSDEDGEYRGYEELREQFREMGEDGDELD